jgi:hypothetical protein
VSGIVHSQGSVVGQQLVPSLSGGAQVHWAALPTGRAWTTKARKENVVAENEPSVEDMNKIIREQLSRRREKGRLLWPAAESTNDGDQEEETDAGD